MADTYTDNRRKNYEVLRSTLEQERASFMSHWRDISDFILPRRAQFSVTDTNRGEKKNQKIIDSTATLAARTLRSGMMGGVTSPARPWFRLSTSDPGLAEYGPVKDWLHVVTQRMATIFLRSNLYNALPVVYGDMGIFGTSALLIEEDFDNVVRCYPFPIGSYMLANNDRLKVDVFFREFRLTVRQVIQRFGKKTESGGMDWSNISAHVKGLYERGTLEAWVDICHVIQPDMEYDPRRLSSKKYESVYYEKGTSGNNQMAAEQEKFLRRAGYDYFPVLAPRWETTGEDVYGTECPGMVALGDVKQLQHGERRGMQAIDKMVNPPMKAPTALKTQKTSLLPGDVTYVDERGDAGGFKPIFEVNFRLAEHEAKQDQKRALIRRAFYEDLFLMLAQTNRREITAEEVRARQEEKVLALGPVLEQLNQDLLDPTIDITFDIMARQGQIPPPPEELQGLDLKIEYISIMHQAQKLAGLAGIDRLVGFVGQVAQVVPEVVDKIDADQLVDEYGDITGAPPRVIRPDDMVAEIRAQRAQAMQAQQQAMALAEGAKAARDLSGASMEGKNALTEMLKMSEAGQIA